MVRSSAARTASVSPLRQIPHRDRYLLARSRAMVDAVIMARSCSALDAPLSAAEGVIPGHQFAWTPFQPICSSRSWPGIRWPLVALAFPYPWSWNHFIFALVPFFPGPQLLPGPAFLFVAHGRLNGEPRAGEQIPGRISCGTQFTMASFTNRGPPLHRDHFQKSGCSGTGRAGLKIEAPSVLSSVGFRHNVNVISL